MDASALLKQARVESRMSQRVLAERAGVSRQTVAHVESGARTPSLGTLVGLLAAAGMQMRVELEPLDADVRRAIEEQRAEPSGLSEAAIIWAGMPQLREVAHRVEGLAAAALLGAPVAVRALAVALPDTPETHDWLASNLRRFQLRLRGEDWVGHWHPDVPDGEEQGAWLRALLREEFPDDRFLLVGPFDEVAARFAAAEEVARCVRVETDEGTIPVQPLDEIESSDPRVARVLRVMRETAGAAAPARIPG
jgi:transcriptional regulator with XRE-family HTH domain